MHVMPGKSFKVQCCLGTLVYYHNRASRSAHNPMVGYVVQRISRNTSVGSHHAIPKVVV